MGLRGRQHLLSMKSEQPLRGKFGNKTSTKVLFSHGLKLVDALLCVALSDLTQRFVFVSACFHVLGV